MSNKKERLFDEFKAPTAQEWLDKIQVDLKGADFNKKTGLAHKRGLQHATFLQKRGCAETQNS